MCMQLCNKCCRVVFWLTQENTSLLKMSSLRGPSAVILWVLHPGLPGAEGCSMEPTHLEDLSCRDTAGIAQRQVTAQLLRMHLKVDTALCHDGPATTASATPSLRAAAWLKSICPLHSERLLSSTETFYSCRKRQVCVLQLFYILNNSTSCFT